jgi:hypothetical protein
MRPEVDERRSREGPHLVALDRKQRRVAVQERLDGLCRLDVWVIRDQLLQWVRFASTYASCGEPGSAISPTCVGIA